MKIFLCLNHFLPAQVAGTEIYCLHLAKFLQNKGYVVTVLFPNYGKQEDNEYEYQGIRVLQFAEPSVVDRELKMNKKIPLGVVAFEKILEKENPALIHFHSIGGSNGVGMPHVRVAARLGIKMLFTLHIAGYTCSTGTLRFKNEIPCDGYTDPIRCTACIYSTKKITGLKARGLLSVASGLFQVGYNSRNWNNRAGTALGFPFMIRGLKNELAEMSRLGEGIVALTSWYKNVLLLNGVPQEKLFHVTQGLPAEAQEEDVREGNFNLPLRIIYIGRIIEDKGLHLLTEAVQELEEENVSLSIYGAAAENGYYEALRHKTKNNKNITWHGVIPPQEITAAIKLHHCLCIPSIICEMSPLVIQEAFAVKVPVVGSDVYGNAEQIADGKNGWLFKFNDSQDLKEKIKKIIQHPHLLSEAKKHIEAVKSFETVGEEYSLIYNQIIQERP